MSRDIGIAVGHAVKPESQNTDMESIGISAVVPVMNECDNILPLCKALVDSLKACNRPYEIIIVDDGSTDGTTAQILVAAEAYPRVRGVFLARNYGQSTAMQAGFDAATGHLVVTLDGDLQNDPADIPRMVDLLEREDVDLVSGWRRNRQDESVRKLFSRIANRLIASMTGVALHDYGCSLKVYRREILTRTRLYGEMHRFIPALLEEVGAQVMETEVTHHPRQFGTSKYKLDRTIRVVLDLLLIMFFRRYLQRPLHVFGGIGLAGGTAGLIILTYLSLLKIVGGEEIGARPLLIFGVMLVLLGVIMLSQGLLGELIVRTLLESGSRKQYHLKSRRNDAGGSR